MAKKGRDKSSAIQRKAGDDDAHIHTNVRRTIANREHMSYKTRDEEHVRALREPFRARVLSGGK